MTPTQALDRSNSAKRILEDPLFIEAFALIEHEIMEQWEACPARDKEAREFLWLLFKNARKFKGILQGAIESGKLAAHELKEKETFMQQMTRKVRM